MRVNDPRRIKSMVIALLSTATLLAGCAGAKVQAGPQTGYEVRRPSTVVVFDFAVQASEVVADTLGPQFVSGRGSKEAREDLGHQVARTLRDQIVAKLIASGISAQPGSEDQALPLDAIVLKGQFVSVDQGDRTKRMLIGFGAGASELRARIQIYQATPRGLMRIREAEAKATGAKTPGMAVPVGVGAVAGTAAVSAAVSGGMNIAREVKGGLHQEAENMAEKIVERCEAYYDRRGWR